MYGERMSEESQDKKRKTINILYIPGGGMFGIIPAVVLGRLEELTETPTIELFQVFEGVSTGSIIAGGVNMPGVTGARGAELFCMIGPKFFPDIPNRTAKMVVANGLSIFKKFSDLDPLQTDSIKIAEIRSHCEGLREELPESDHYMIDDLEEIATKRWLTKSNAQKALKLCEFMHEHGKAAKTHAASIAELLSVRKKTGMLSSTWRRAVSKGIDCIKSKWAKDYLFDPEVPKETFKSLFGDNRISDTLRSTYISAYDIVNQQIVTFKSRKKDFFEIGSEQEEVSENNAKLWDVVMGSIAHQGAFPPHEMEDGRIVLDKAIVHQPQAVDDVLKHKPEDADVKVIVLGTGKLLDEESDLNSEEIIERYKENNIIGNLLLGNEIAELEAYIMSSKINYFKQLLGDDHVIEINPRMSPHTTKEEEEFPSHNILDASEENIRKILMRACKLIEDRDAEIRALAQDLVDNLHVLGQIDEEKYERVTKRIGLKEPDPAQEPAESEISKEIPSMYERVFGRSNESLSSVFKRFLGLDEQSTSQKVRSVLDREEPKKDDEQTQEPPRRAKPGNSDPKP